jgi:C1A family cysteine protease
MTPNKKINLSGHTGPAGTGWLSPLPDPRDYTTGHPGIEPFNNRLGLSTDANDLPDAVDIREWCSPVEDQLSLGSCTAHAGVAIVEYFERRAFGKHIEASRLFLYKTTRNIMQVTGDTGAWLRDTMGALVLCGVPAERYWPYDIDMFDREPDSFVYSLADNYETVKYFCHDPVMHAANSGTPVNRRQSGKTTEGGAGIGEQDVLDSVKKYLAAGIPSMFGFWGFPSFEESATPGDIPSPCPGEQAQWGHAVVAVGYDDDRRIVNTACGTETTGAIMIRNSWGAAWGDKGYGWLPYKYVINRLALDFWSMIDMKWIDSGAFGF